MTPGRLPVIAERDVAVLVVDDFALHLDRFLSGRGRRHDPHSCEGECTHGFLPWNFIVASDKPTAGPRQARLLGLPLPIVRATATALRIAHDALRGLIQPACVRNPLCVMRDT